MRVLVAVRRRAIPTPSWSSFPCSNRCNTCCNSPCSMRRSNCYNKMSGGYCDRVGSAPDGDSINSNNIPGVCRGSGTWTARVPRHEIYYVSVSRPNDMPEHVQETSAKHG